jgi:hypothetical protein
VRIPVAVTFDSPQAVPYNRGMDIKYLLQRRTCLGSLARALSPGLPAALLAAALLSAAAAAPAQGVPNDPPAPNGASTQPAPAPTGSGSRISIAAPAAPNGAGTRPVEAGTSVTISTPAASPAKVRTMADRIAITDMERTVLDAVRDGIRQIDETGLYVGLGIAARAAGNVQLDPDEWSQLDRPAYVSLLAEPKLWRGRPVQATVSIFRVMKLKSGDGLNYSDFWPKDHPVWRMDGVLSDGQAAADQSIIIFSVVNPAEFLGLGQPGTGKAEMEYKKGPRVRVAAIFYKDLIDTDRKGAVRLYPIVMAWQLSRSDESFARYASPPDGLMTRLAPVVILLVALAGGFYLLRRRMTRMRQSRIQGSRYQPLRSQATPGGVRDAPVNPADAHVDPELAAALEQYLHQEGHDETKGTHGAPGKNRRG